MKQRNPGHFTNHAESRSTTVLQNVQENAHHLLTTVRQEATFASGFSDTNRLVLPEYSAYDDGSEIMFRSHTSHDNPSLLLSAAHPNFAEFTLSRDVDGGMLFSDVEYSKSQNGNHVARIALQTSLDGTGKRTRISQLGSFVRTERGLILFRPHTGHEVDGMVTYVEAPELPATVADLKEIATSLQEIKEGKAMERERTPLQRFWRGLGSAVLGRSQ